MSFACRVVYIVFFSSAFAIHILNTLIYKDGNPQCLKVLNQAELGVFNDKTLIKIYIYKPAQSSKKGEWSIKKRHNIEIYDGYD